MLQKISLFLFLFIPGALMAQTTNRISLMTFVKEDAVLIRWAPSTSALYDQAIQKGWVLDRYEIINGQADVSTKRQINIPAVKVDELSNEDANRGILESYKNSQNQKAAHDLAYMMLMLNSGLNQNAGMYFRLFTKDTGIEKNKTYEYRIRINGTNTPEGKTIVSTAELSKHGNMSELRGKSYRKHGILEWNADSIKSHYAGFWIERSTDNVNFIRVNKHPFVFLKTQYEKNKTIASFQDTATLEGNTYYFRVTGISHFGEIGLSSNAVKIHIHHLYEGSLQIDTVRLDKQQAHFGFTIFPEQPKLRSLTKSLTLEKSDKATGPYQSVLSFSPQGNFENYTLSNFSDNRVFFRLTAVSEEGDSLISNPYYFFYLDQVPPEIPTGLQGMSSPKGIVTLQWKRNKDSDLKAYRVFRSNALNEEFIEISKRFITDTVFNDTLSLQTLNRSVYYCVRAVDQNFNNSQSSAPLKIMRPDIVPPVGVVFTKTESSKKGVNLAWHNSTSEDILEYRLLRHSGTKDTLLVKWTTKQAMQQFTDSSIIPGLTCYYTIEVEDSSSNVTPSSTHPFKFENGIRAAPMLKETVVNREKQSITIQWDYLYPSSEIYCYYIFRKKNDGQWTLIHTMKSGNTYTDFDLNMNNQYEYRVQAMFSSGIKSIFSNAVKATY